MHERMCKTFGFFPYHSMSNVNPCIYPIMHTTCFAPIQICRGDPTFNVWEHSTDFDAQIMAYVQGHSSRALMQWVDWLGNPIDACGEVAVSDPPTDTITQIIAGEQLSDLAHLRFRDPNRFLVGELHNHCDQWQVMAGSHPSPQQAIVLNWITNKVSVFDYFRPFLGSFKGKSYHFDRPPSEHFRNNFSYKLFTAFVQKTILDRLQTGAISLLGKVEQAEPPYLILPLTVELSKPRLCHDARFLNLWMTDKPFSLDTLTHLPRYVSPNS